MREGADTAAPGPGLWVSGEREESRAPPSQRYMWGNVHFYNSLWQGREINVTFIPSFVHLLFEYPGTPPRTRTVFGAGDTEVNKNDF